MHVIDPLMYDSIIDRFFEGYVIFRATTMQTLISQNSVLSGSNKNLFIYYILNDTKILKYFEVRKVPQKASRTIFIQMFNGSLPGVVNSYLVVVAALSLDFLIVLCDYYCWQKFFSNQQEELLNDL
uniref:Uncharacterized protein n=1 Tax=Glossina brevipalpis TaxID=37001 RepID=A0A1A9W268_9MUSC